MMRKNLPILLLVVLSAAVASPGLAADRSFGEQLSPELDPIEITDILAEPDAWEGRRVRVEGRVGGVCESQGCWLELVADDGSRLEVKVEDGVIVFPTDAVGHWAAAQGTVEIIELTRERYEGWLKHRAEESGEEFDPDSVGDGPYRIVQLRGTGCKISDA